MRGHRVLSTVRITLLPDLESFEMRRYVDTETTGLHRAGGDELVEVAVIDDCGNVLLSTLVNPGLGIPLEATAIHGITDEMVAAAPPPETARTLVAALCLGHEVVIYNADFDCGFLDLRSAASVECCMRRFARYHGEWDELRAGYRWKRLKFAADYAGFEWPLGGAHRAAADAMACRHVWRWLDEQEAARLGGRSHDCVADRLEIKTLLEEGALAHQ